MAPITRFGFIGIVLIGLGLIGSPYVSAQNHAYDVVVRPIGLKYDWLKTSHFNIIFERGAQADAREMGAILEAHWEGTRSLVGVSRSLRMPVVLNRYNDRSNGYVTPVPFKQEIELPSIKGKALSPKFDSWLEMVGTHELTHAAHAEFGSGFGVVGAVRLIAPDLARALNLAVPPGISEGVAVYQESQIRPKAGRLHHAYFNMQFNAAAVSERPWRLAQLMEVPAYSLPPDRYYVGGAHFFKYLMAKEGRAVFHRASSLHYFFPFFGYGINLWYATKTPPWVLGKDFRKMTRVEGEKRIAELGPVTLPKIVSSKQGLIHRRPRWLHDDTLLVYMSGYNIRPGFYVVEVNTGQRRAVGYHRIAEDYEYALEPEQMTLLFARYVQAPLVSTQASAELFKLNLKTGDVEQWTTHGRVMTPSFGPAGEVWALQNDGPFTRWVQRTPDGHLHPVSDIHRLSFVSVQAAPKGGTVAVVANRGGRQGIYRAHMEGDKLASLKDWIVFKEASIYDIAWAPDGRHLLFSADINGISNLYALDIAREEVVRLTNVAFGAMEPALSPDGKTLAYVEYQHERYNLVTTEFSPSTGLRLSREEWHATSKLQAPSPTSTVDYGEAIEGGIHPYQALRNVKPRIVYPTFRYEANDLEEGDTDLGIGLGLRVEGVDPLQKWAFVMEGLFQKARAWGEAELRYGGSWLHPTLKIYDRPNTVLAREINQEQQTSKTIRLGREERGFSLGLRTPVSISNNVYQSRAAFSIISEYRQERLFDNQGRTRRGFDERFTLAPAATYFWRLQQNKRDLVPNTGLVLFSRSEWDLLVGQGIRRKALVTLVDLYLPFLAKLNGGVRFRTGLLTQNQGSIFNLAFFMPRGQDHVFLGKGTFLRYGVEVSQPLWFFDNGFFILPLYFKALFAYGFADTVHDVTTFQGRVSSAGLGVGLQIRVFYFLDLEFRLGAAYLVEDRSWDRVYR